MATITLDLSRIPYQGPVSGGQVWVAGGEILMVKYFDELRSTEGHDDLTICRALINAVEQGLQPYVFSVFLPWCKDPTVLTLCMAYESNAAVRSAAIKDLGRRLKKPSKQNNSTSLSQILGDTQSLLTLFAQSSVKDVRDLCVAISSSGRHGRQHQLAFQERQEGVERLLRALLPAVYPAAQTAARCRDKRPLQHFYAIMLPACSAEFVAAVLDAQDQSNPLFRWRNVRTLMRSHRALFRKRAADHLFGLASKSDPDVHHFIDIFLDQDKDFALSALQGRHNGKITDQRWGTYAEAGIALDLVQRIARRRHSARRPTQIHDLVQQGLEILARKPPSVRNRQRSDGVELWTYALNGWRERPELFEEALVLGLQLGLGSSPASAPRDYLSAATRQGFPEAQRPRLLQLYCLHVGKEGCDIFAPDARFANLAKRLWPSEVFSHLEAEQSIRILKELEAVNPEYSFLGPPSTISILGLREVAGQSNFNVDLLLTQLQCDDPDAIQKARDVVDELRKKAAAAREQGDRAELAEAASTYAIATGDLDLYGDTVLWQQRFVRDPLTARRIFGRARVLTVEGIELLSALQSREVLQEDALAVKIRKADDILKTFYETYRLAKREPSFQPSDWSSVKSLFGAVYQKRVQNLQSVRDTRHNGIVWEGVLAAIKWMDIEFLKHIRSPVMDFLSALSPVLLASATQDLLRVGTERRKEQNRTPEDDLLDEMSYQALGILAMSNTPALASDLVVQTIIDRPDASSWHRQLLSTGFLKRLRANEAYEVLLKLAQAIGDKLDEQSYVRVGESEPEKHAPPKSMVKVTTVKYLAQLLNNADFIPSETAVAVLIELFKNAQHRDIRLAALESLLSLLDRLCTEAKDGWAANPTVDMIMRALETVVPVAGSINERRPPRDEDWAEAEATGVLPGLGDLTAGGLGMPPLMQTLLSAAEDIRYRGLRIMQTAFVERIVLPVIRQSQAEHGRWIKLFLAKYKAPFAASDVPHTPVAVYAWHRVLTAYYPLMDPAILADFDAYTVHQIAPDMRVAQFTTALQADIELRKRAEVQHWIQVYGYRANSFLQTGTSTLMDVMRTQYDASLGGVEYGPAIDIVCRHAELFLDHYEEYAQSWDHLMASLGPSLQTVTTSKVHRSWRDTSGRIVRHISDEVGTRKAEKVQHILPPGIMLELWLLPFLALNSGGESSDFVVQLEEVLVRLLEGDESQILDWSDMADDVCSVSTLIKGEELKSKVAEHFGKLTDNKDIAVRAGHAQAQTRRALDLIKVKVAMHLFDKCNNEEMVRGAGRERLKEWFGSSSDAIRERVFRWKGRVRIERGRDDAAKV